MTSHKTRNTRSQCPKQLAEMRFGENLQAIEAAEGALPKNKNKKPAFNNPSYEYGNPLSRMVGTAGKRLNY